ncbi:hypothetical protein [Vandammella animalimorsus]|uniref:hypothetical protein n=1 Tax=Vandammella animalimorsus TaxID=2029117 RepID=UPI001EED639D|nr:hypothetical protein [Vandammella animalimorsus]
MGRCPACKAWNSLQETAAPAAPRAPLAEAAAGEPGHRSQRPALGGQRAQAVRGLQRRGQHQRAVQRGQRLPRGQAQQQAGDGAPAAPQIPGQPGQPLGKQLHHGVSLFFKNLFKIPACVGKRRFGMGGKAHKAANRPCDGPVWQRRRAPASASLPAAQGF